MSKEILLNTVDNGNQGMRIKVPVTLGFMIIILFFGVFGVWATVAPLESAAVAMGVVSVDSQRKTIQHLEGGIIAALNVEEGQVVKAGDVLIQLDETQPRANLELLRARLMTARALEARLLTERDNKENITFPEELIQKLENKEVAEIIEGQLNIFNARRQAMSGQISIIEQQIKQN